MRRITTRVVLPLAVVAGSVAACSENTPVEPGAGFADVAGRVLDVAGAPLAADTVAIACAGGAFGTTVVTDAGGHYLVSLSAPASQIGGTNGSTACVFSVGTPAPTRFQVTARIGFGAAGIPHALQLIDLRATR